MPDSGTINPMDLSNTTQQGISQDSMLHSGTVNPMDLSKTTQQGISQENTPHPGTTSSQPPNELSPMNQLSANHDLAVVKESTPHPGTTMSQSSNEFSLTGQLSSNRDFAIVNGYDHFWVEKKKPDPRTIKIPSADMKFGLLCYEGVIQKGDCFKIAITRKISGVSHQDEAILTVRSF